MVAYVNIEYHFLEESKVGGIQTPGPCGTENRGVLRGLNEWMK